MSMWIISDTPNNAPCESRALFAVTSRKIRNKDLPLSAKIPTADAVGIFNFIRFGVGYCSPHQLRKAALSTEAQPVEEWPPPK